MSDGTRISYSRHVVEVGQFGLSFLATDTGFRVHQTGEQFSATIVGELVFGNRT